MGTLGGRESETIHTKLARVIGKPSIKTASRTPISTPSSKAFVATIPTSWPVNASCSIFRRSWQRNSLRWNHRFLSCSHRPECYNLHDRHELVPGYHVFPRHSTLCEEFSSPTKKCWNRRDPMTRRVRAHQLTNFPMLYKAKTSLSRLGRQK